MMNSTGSANSKRIASNSFFLVIRMLFLMVISFFTSRIVLDKLGVVDFGINNVVGGLTTMLVFFRSSLSNVTQRFLSIELGTNNIEGARKIFRQHQTVYLVISFVLVILSETIGLWFLENKLVIPEDRLTAAFWVYQFMIVSIVITLLSVVYDSAIVAHENFKIYAYIAIIEGLSKLGIALLLNIIHFDRLITYAFLMLLSAIIIRMIYTIYCHRYYQECVFRFDYNLSAFKSAFGMIGWNTFGTAVHAVNNQGIDILLNLFFGPIVNAARGIASQISHATTVFCNSFYTSVRPQITKAYASNDTDYMLKLFYRSSKYGFYIMLIVSLPMIFSIEPLLNLWLKKVPDYAASFAILVMVYSIVNSLQEPIWSLILSVGKLKKYVIIGSSVYLCFFPISYIFLRFGYSPESVFIIHILVRMIYIYVVLLLLKEYVQINMIDYLKSVVVPIIVVTVISVVLCLLMKQVLNEIDVNWVLFAMIYFILGTTVVFIIGIGKEERLFIVSMLSNFSNRLNRK